MTRRLALLLVLLAAVLAGGWFAAAELLKSRIADWAERQRRAGVTVDYRHERMAGFPFAVTAELATPRLAEAGRSWSAGRLAVSWRLFDPLALSFETSGPQEFANGGQQFRLVADEAAVRLAGGSTRASLEQAVLTLPGNIELAKARRLSVIVSRRDEPADAGPALPARWHAEVNAVALAAAEFQHPADLELAADLRGEIGGGDLRTALSDWRDRGGTLDVIRLDLADPDLKVTGSGTLALDRSLRPEGAFTARIEGLGAVLDRLVAAGRVRERDAQFARLVLAGLAKPDPSSGRPVVEIPVTAQNGALFVGPARLAKLDPVLE